MARTAPQTPPRGSWTLPFIIGLLITFALGSVLIISRIQGSLQSRHPAVELPHIHGLGFSPEGQLMVPAHSGLQVFTSGAWQSPTIPPMDYMGFVITDDGFYSSGHPSATSNLRNPIGLVKSTDGGKTLVKLGFEGESDFHLMGVGYHNHAIYVLNPSPNSKLGTGLYYSLDDGKTWGQSKADGIASQPLHVAVHPTQANVVALATAAGLFLSTDHGNTFSRIGTDSPVTTSAFSPDGKWLLLGATTLSVYDLERKQVKVLKAPKLGAQDAMSYIAINPATSDELAIATFERSIYLSQDGGQSWKQIAKAGWGL